MQRLRSVEDISAWKISLLVTGLFILYFYFMIQFRLSILTVIGIGVIANCLLDAFCIRL